jgi:hypothetical protein
MQNLNWAYQGLLFFFVSDTSLKLLGFGIRRYFGTTWRLIEFIVSVISLIDLIIDFYFSWFDKYLAATEENEYFILYRLFFILRDLRILLII